nr:MAG TPA: hypothetical protein [Caudoviricetes sp.]
MPEITLLTRSPAIPAITRHTRIITNASTSGSPVLGISTTARP